jgi:hypothetical protein
MDSPERLPEMQDLMRGFGGNAGFGAIAGFVGDDDFTTAPGFGGTGGPGDLGCLHREAGLAGTGGDGENLVTFL